MTEEKVKLHSFSVILGFLLGLLLELFFLEAGIAMLALPDVNGYREAPIAPKWRLFVGSVFGCGNEQGV